jgi:hypothetical protein
MSQKVVAFDLHMICGNRTTVISRIHYDTYLIHFTPVEQVHRTPSILIYTPLYSHIAFAANES